MLVSDYDGTFDGKCTDGRVLNLQLNCEKVKEFIEQGNIFVLASDVDCKILISIAKRNNIPYSYLVGYNGICDTEGKISYDDFKDISKSQAVSILKKQLRIDDEDIYTIGDGRNDIRMVEWWNGFHVGNNKEIAEVSLGQYQEVHELVDDIVMKKAKIREF